jgi:tight adherence protein D
MLGPEITEEEAFNHFAALRNSEAIVQHVAEPILSSKKQELQ